MLNIAPIRLLKGSHADTGTTGQGCFMNVVAYLNGEAQITDQSECVCVTVRTIAVWLNDYLRDDERHIMIPYVERAMGSATMDKRELSRRAWLAVKMANEMKVIAYAAYAAYDDAARAARAADNADNAAKYAAKYASYADADNADNADNAAKYASYATKYASDADADADATRAAIVKSVFAFLDAALPPACDPSPQVVERAETLAKLAATVE